MRLIYLESIFALWTVMESGKYSNCRQSVNLSKKKNCWKIARHLSGLQPQFFFLIIYDFNFLCGSLWKVRASSSQLATLSFHFIIDGSMVRWFVYLNNIYDIIWSCLCAHSPHRRSRELFGFRSETVDRVQGTIKSRQNKNWKKNTYWSSSVLGAWCGNISSFHFVSAFGNNSISKSISWT